MDKTSTKRRWFQFSLRTLFVFVTLAAIPLGWLGWQASIVRERKAMLKLIEQYPRPDIASSVLIPLILREPAPLPWYRTLLGDEEEASIFLPTALSNKRDEVRRLFPEAIVN